MLVLLIKGLAAVSRFTLGTSYRNQIFNNRKKKTKNPQEKSKT